MADVEIHGQIHVAHVPNTGSLKSCLAADMPCLLSPAENPERKLRWTLEMVKPENHWIGINTQHPNLLVKSLISSLLNKSEMPSQLAHWRDTLKVQSEVKISKESRLDLCLHKANKKHFIEVKNVTLKEGHSALFPDCVSERATKHLHDLMTLKNAGHDVELVFVVQRGDCQTFSPANEIDPVYAKTLKAAAEAGVKITPLRCDLGENHLELTTEVLPLGLF